MNPDLRVDAEELRRTASAISATAARVTAAREHEPPPPAVPRWSTTDPALLTAAAAGQQLAHLGSDIAETAGRIRAAAAAYELADARAATRLRLAR